MHRRLATALERDQLVRRGQLSIERAYAQLLNDCRTWSSEVDALTKALERARARERDDLGPKLACQYGKCGKAFIPKMSNNQRNAKYCSDACRQAAYKQRKLAKLVS